MSALLVVAGVLATGLVAGTWLFYVAAWRGFRDYWRRVPHDRRRREIAAGAATFVVILTGGALAVAAPWGPYSVLYVVAAGGALGMPLMLIGIASQVRGNQRRLKHRQAAPGAQPQAKGEPE